MEATLQTPQDANIFALGDCAAAPGRSSGRCRLIPPRAQAAHQRKKLHLKPPVQRRLRGQPLRDFRYRDFGSLVSLGESWAVGGLMGNLAKGTLFVEGYIARFMYNMLYKETSVWPARFLAGAAGYTGQLDSARLDAASNCTERT
ncbi:MAG: hypothetical protein R3E89_15195 [Thiolinea sp.]